MFQVFKNCYIPRTLEEVLDYRRDVSKAKEGDTEEVRLDLDTHYKILFLIDSEIIYWM